MSKPPFYQQLQKMSLHGHVRTLTVPQFLKLRKITLLSCFYKTSIVLKSETLNILVTQGAWNDWIYIQCKSSISFMGCCSLRGDFLSIQCIGLFFVLFLLPKWTLQVFLQIFYFVFKISTQDRIISPTERGNVWM